MLNVNDYVKLILQKKKWNNTEFCNRLNELETKLGDKKTHPQNMSAYLNGIWPLRPKLLVKWEYVLGLKENTLVSMVSEPLSKEGKKELKETIEKIKGVK